MDKEVATDINLQAHGGARYSEIKELEALKTKEQLDAEEAAR